MQVWIDTGREYNLAVMKIYNMYPCKYVCFGLRFLNNFEESATEHRLRLYAYYSDTGLYHPWGDGSGDHYYYAGPYDDSHLLFCARQVAEEMERGTSSLAVNLESGIVNGRIHNYFSHK